VTINLENEIKEDLSEQYLYSEHECAIINFAVSPDFCSGIGKLNGDYYLKGGNECLLAHTY
jgi:hypothetical protein